MKNFKDIKIMNFNSPEMKKLVAEIAREDELNRNADWLDERKWQEEKKLFKLKAKLWKTEQQVKKLREKHSQTYVLEKVPQNELEELQKKMKQAEELQEKVQQAEELVKSLSATADQIREASLLLRKKRYAASMIP